MDLDGVSTFYLSQGVLGASCVVLMVVIAVLWRSREKDRVDQAVRLEAYINAHKTELAAKDALITELQEQRLQEALAGRDAIRSIQTTLDAFLQAVRGKGLQ